MRAIIMRASGADRQREERTGFARVHVQRQEWPPVASQGHYRNCFRKGLRRSRSLFPPRYYMFAQGSVESTHKVPTSHYHTKHRLALRSRRSVD